LNWRMQRGCSPPTSAQRRASEIWDRVLDVQGTGLMSEKAFEALKREALYRRQTHVLDLPVSRMIAIVPTPSAGAHVADSRARARREPQPDSNSRFDGLDTAPTYRSKRPTSTQRTQAPHTVVIRNRSAFDRIENTTHRHPAAGASLDLIGDLVQASLDAGLVDARRAREANAADKITRIGSPPGTAMTLGSVTCSRTTGSPSARRFAYAVVEVPKLRAVYALRRAFSMACGLALSPPGQLWFAVAVDDDRRNAMVARGATLDRRLRDCLGDRIGKIAAREQLGVRGRSFSGQARWRKRTWVFANACRLLSEYFREVHRWTFIAERRLSDGQQRPCETGKLAVWRQATKSIRREFPTGITPCNFESTSVWVRKQSDAAAQSFYLAMGL